MARRYTVAFENVAIAAAQDLFLLKPAADKPIRVLAVFLSNVGGTADAGDAQEELLRIKVAQLPATVTNGSVGTAPTPQKVDPNDSAAGFTARANDTTRASTSGTAAMLHADGWNVRVPFALVLTPEMQWETAGSTTGIVIGLEAAPADSINVSGTVYVEEE